MESYMGVCKRAEPLSIVSGVAARHLIGASTEILLKHLKSPWGSCPECGGSLEDLWIMFFSGTAFGEDMPVR
jgi:hypothetical protein